MATNIKVKGIDVSSWQGQIDWKKVKTDGIKFAMIRLGFGSATGDKCGLDPRFEENVKNAITAGVDVGCYFYSYATSVAAVKKEAAFVVGVLNKHKGQLTYPVAFDLEDNSQTGLGKTVLTEMVIAFGDAIEKAGFYCSLYSNLNWLYGHLDDSRLKRFDHWLAQWSVTPTYSGAFGIWQYSSTGKVNGISGDVDMNYAYKDYPTLIKNGKLNGFTAGTTQKPASSTPSVPAATTTTPTIKVGTLVKVTGSAYTTGQAIPSWVKAKNWYVKEIRGDLVIIDRSEDGQNAISSPVWAKDLQIVSATQETASERIYTVVTGDTLWGIAQKLLGKGSRYTEIVKLNGLKSSMIYSGQRLKIPNK